VIIGNNVTEIGSDLFFGCSSLTSVTIPDSVTSIGENAFYGCSKLKSVFYQGNQNPKECSEVFSSSLDDVCVSPDYSLDSFCGIKVTSDSPLCQEFSGLFNHCYKGTYIDGGFIQQERNNATAWEEKTNSCTEYQCDNEEGPISWSKCNSSVDVIRECVNDTCIENKKNNSVEIELKPGVKEEEMNKEQILNNLNELYKIDSEDIAIEWETDKNGYVIRVVFYVKDEKKAKDLSDAVSGCIHE